MSHILSTIQERRSFRGVSDKAIPEDVLARILEAATLAPSCGNSQPWRFLVLRDGASLDRGREYLAGGNYWAKRAPVLVLVITRVDLDCRIGSRDYAEFDTGMAVMNLQLQAWHEGIYAHPMAGFKAKAMSEAFGIDESGHKLLTVLALGYGGDTSGLGEKHVELESSERDRKPLADVVRFNEWTSPDPESDGE